MLMPRKLLSLCLALLIGSSLTVGPARAGINPDGKLVLHLVPVKKRPKQLGICDRHGVEKPSDVVTKGELDQRYLAYVLITDFDTEVGITGAQFGVSYNGAEKEGVDIVYWQNCTLYEWPMDDWPGPETGNLLTWNQNDDCQTAEPLVVGMFYLTAYSPDRLKIIPRPVDDMARLAACGVNSINSAEKLDTLKPENLGWVDFGGGEGYNPWDPEQNLLELQNKFKPIKD